MKVGGAWRWRRGDAAVCVTRGRELEFARSGAIEKPRRQHAVIDHSERLRGDAFAIERARTQTALAQRIVDNADAGLEQPLAKLVVEEAGLARHCAAVGGARKMTDQRPCDSAVEHHRHFCGGDLAWVEARDGALAGSAANPLRR